MSNINALQQANIPVKNVQVPAEGPLSIPLLLDFTANPSYFIDGKPVTDAGNFSMIQTIWIDATNATATVIVTISGINQTINGLAGSQGYYPVLCPNPFHITISCASVSAPGVLVNVTLINVPIAPGVWPNGATGATGPAGPAGPTGPTGPAGPVSSVGLTSTDFTVSGSPITSSGNITANLVVQGGLTPATYGDATHVGQFAVNSKGVITSASNVAISGGSSGALVLVEEHTASSSASLQFTTGITSTFDDYMIEFVDLIPATNNVKMWIRMSTNGGVSYDAGTNYDWCTWGYDSAAGGAGGANATNQLVLSGDQNVNTTSGWSFNGSFRLKNPLGGALFTAMFGQCCYFANPNNALEGFQFAGAYIVTTAVNAFEVLFSSGNIASGTVRLYGLSH